MRTGPCNWHRSCARRDNSASASAPAGLSRVTPKGQGAAASASVCSHCAASAGAGKAAGRITRPSERPAWASAGHGAPLARASAQAPVGPASPRPRVDKTECSRCPVACRPSGQAALPRAAPAHRRTSAAAVGPAAGRPAPEATPPSRHGAGPTPVPATRSAPPRPAWAPGAPVPKAGLAGLPPARPARCAPAWRKRQAPVAADRGSAAATGGDEGPRLKRGWVGSTWAISASGRHWPKRC